MFLKWKYNVPGNPSGPSRFDLVRRDGIDLPCVFFLPFHGCLQLVVVMSSRGVCGRLMSEGQEPPVVEGYRGEEHSQGVRG